MSRIEQPLSLPQSQSNDLIRNALIVTEIDSGRSPTFGSGSPFARALQIESVWALDQLVHLALADRSINSLDIHTSAVPTASSVCFGAGEST